MFCPHCGAQLPDGARFCDSCGARLNAQEDQSYQPPSYPEPPSYSGDPSFVRQQESPRGGGGKKKILFLAVGLVIAVAAVFGIRSILDDGEPVTYAPNQIRPSSGSSAGSSGLSSGSSGSSSSGSSSSGSSGASSSSGSSSVSGGVSSGTQAYEQWILGDSGGSSSGSASSAASYSTDKLPHPEDFQWYYDVERNLVSAAIPEGASLLTEPSQISGGWMANVVRRPVTDPYPQYWNINLSVSGTSVDMVQRWSGMIEGGAFKDASQANTNPFKGTVDDRMILTLKDEFGNELQIVQWYEYNGKQYGMGIYSCVWDQGDSDGLAAVCRP